MGTFFLSPDIIIGGLVGVLLVAATFVAPLIRNAVLAAAALGIMYAYWQDGIDGVLFNAKLLLSIVWLDIATHEMFMDGLLIGAVLAAITLVAFRRRKR